MNIVELIAFIVVLAAIGGSGYLGFLLGQMLPKVQKNTRTKKSNAEVVDLSEYT